LESNFRKGFMSQLQGKVAIVTGDATGIGLAITEMLS
jgi:NAD(P)-dependent dehydrogenase (short-subunit alcohol dehydrogenase family)